MTINAELLKRWTEQLCRLATASPAEAAAALGIAGSIVDKGRDYATVEPPPAGTTKLMIVKGDAGVDHLDVMLSEPLVRGDLDARFGEGKLLPRVSAGRAYKLAYHVVVAGAPYTCEVVASFPEEPTAPTSVATEVILRRDRAS